jgi:hypothetical protein
MVQLWATIAPAFRSFAMLGGVIPTISTAVEVVRKKFFIVRSKKQMRNKKAHHSDLWRASQFKLQPDL